MWRGPSRTIFALTVMVWTSPAHAEFEIQESTIDPGETQLQYRGAWHRGLPKGEETEDVDLSLDPGEAALKQSQDFEIQYSPTSFWLVALTHVFDEPADNYFRLNSIEFETQFELVTREGDGLGLAIQGGTEQPVFDTVDEADPEIAFGPIVELSKSNYTLVLNPLFFREIGDKNDQEGFGFEYGWQGRKELFGERLWLAVEMFGEIEDMSNAGPFDLQQHSIGPAFYYTFGKEDDFEDDWGDIDRKSKELTVSVGAQFGLTKATSDVALKIFIGYEFD
ncbi:MAG: hypothetical protein AAGF48_11075 [Pseudomonadota bacterium]